MDKENNKKASNGNGQTKGPGPEIPERITRQRMRIARVCHGRKTSNNDVDGNQTETPWPSNGSRFGRIGSPGCRAFIPSPIANEQRDSGRVQAGQASKDREEISAQNLGDKPSLDDGALSSVEDEANLVIEDRAKAPGSTHDHEVQPVSAGGDATRSPKESFAMEEDRQLQPQVHFQVERSHATTTTAERGSASNLKEDDHDGNVSSPVETLGNEDGTPREGTLAFGSREGDDTDALFKGTDQDEQQAFGSVDSANHDRVSPSNEDHPRKASDNKNVDGKQTETPDGNQTETQPSSSNSSNRARAGPHNANVGGAGTGGTRTGGSVANESIGETGPGVDEDGAGVDAVSPGVIEDLRDDLAMTERNLAHAEFDCEHLATVLCMILTMLLETMDELNEDNMIVLRALWGRLCREYPGVYSYRGAVPKLVASTLNPVFAHYGVTAAQLNTAYQALPAGTPLHGLGVPVVRGGEGAEGEGAEGEAG